MCRRSDLEEHQPAPWAQHARRFGEHGRDRGEVAEREPAGERVGRRRPQRQGRGVGAHEGRGDAAAAGHREHDGSEVDPQNARAGRGRQLRQVAGAAGHVDDDVARAEARRRDRGTPPALVESPGEDAVQAVVGRRDAVEHGADDPRLVVRVRAALAPRDLQASGVRRSQRVPEPRRVARLLEARDGPRHERSLEVVRDQRRHRREQLVERARRRRRRSRSAPVLSRRTWSSKSWIAWSTTSRMFSAWRIARASRCWSGNPPRSRASAGPRHLHVDAAVPRLAAHPQGLDDAGVLDRGDQGLGHAGLLGQLGAGEIAAAALGGEGLQQGAAGRACPGREESLDDRRAGSRRVAAGGCGGAG